MLSVDVLVIFWTLRQPARRLLFLPGRGKSRPGFQKDVIIVLSSEISTRAARGEDANTAVAISDMEFPIRVLVAKPGLDGHDRGAKIIARALRDAGMEVIYTGLRQTPEMIVNAALQEDVQVIGLSILSGAHNAIVPRVLELLREKEMAGVKVIVGGIIPDEDARELERQGVTAVFQPGASLETIVSGVRQAVGHSERPAAK